MPKTFFAEILTPERLFFTGNVVAVTLESIGGRMTVLADHVPMVSALSVGQMVIRTEDRRMTAFHSTGFVDVTRDFVVVLCQTCEWPEEIDGERAREAAERAEAAIETEKNAGELAREKAALLRARLRLRVKEGRRESER